MKMPFRVISAVLCALLILSMPFFLSSPTLLPEAQEEITADSWDTEDGEELDFGRFFFAAAAAEEAAAAMEVTDEEDPFALPEKLRIPEEWELPLDFSIPPEPNPDCFTENGYEDASIRVRVETREMKESTVHVAYVEIASASQLRTATAFGKWNRTVGVSNMADTNHAVIAMNGDDFIQDPGKKLFEVRMTQNVPKRNRTNRTKDTLVIDKNGDFHFFLLSAGMADYIKGHRDEIVNAFMFGPALVVDGEIAEPKDEYGYHRTGHEPRSAIGQTGPLSYAMVVVEARGKSKGVTHDELAEIMKELGCLQAYNLDGGNSAEMIMIGPEKDYPMFHFKGDQTAGNRNQSDIIYFATAVPVEER